MACVSSTHEVNDAIDLLKIKEDKVRNNPLFKRTQNPSQEVDHLPVQRPRVGAWNNFEFDTNVVDAISAIVLSPLPPNQSSLF